MKKLLFGILFLLSVSFANAQWVQTNGPEGGIVNCMAANGSNIFVAIENEGIYRSTNNGHSWVAANNGLTYATWFNPNTLISVTAMAVNTNKIFAGTNEGKVFVSLDNGQSWSPASTGLADVGNIMTLVVSRNNIFAGTSDGGVFISSNNGQSWSPVNTGLTTKEVRSLVVFGNSIIAGCPGVGIFISTDNGQTWIPANTGLTSTMVFSLAVSGSNIFAGTMGGGVFLSTNNGESWSAANSGLTSPGIFTLASSGDSIFAGAYTMYNSTGVLSEDNTFEGGIFLSTNSGQSWSKLSAGLEYDINSLIISGNNIFAGTQGGGVLLSSDNGQNWSLDNAGIINTSVRALAYNGNNIFAGTQGGGIFLSTDNGQNWSAKNSGLANTNVQALAYVGNSIFAGTQGSGIFISSDNGQSWSPANTGLTNGCVTALAVNGNNIFAGTYNIELNQGGLFLSTNNGQSWSATTTGLTNSNISSLAISGNNIFAGTYGGGVFLSTNAGQSWSEVNTGLTGKDITSLTISGDNILASINQGKVFRSNNNGQSWSELEVGFSSGASQLLIASHDSVFAGSSGPSQVFFWTNDGHGWSEVENTALFHTSSVGSLALYRNNIFAGINSGGVWKSPLTKLIKLPFAPTVDTITQPTCSDATGSVVLSGLPTDNWWTINLRGIIGSTASITISALAPGTYNFTVTNAAGCTSDTSVVVIDAQPATPTAPDIKNIIQPSCSVATGSVVLTNLPSGNWTINPGAITGSANGTTITGLAPGTYNYTVTNASGCTSDASADVVINTQPAQPATPIISLLNDSTLHSDAPIGNQWYNQSGMINGARSQEFIVKENGDYYVFVTINGCVSDTSNTINVVISGITYNGDRKTITVYPNPFTKELIIEIKGNTKKVKFNILNSMGQVVFKGNLIEKTFVPTLSFAPGVYIIKFESENRIEFKKVIKN